MGFFSWKTSDTKRSISNVYSSRGTFPVYVLLPDGRKIVETEYEGYGVFGGRDFYGLVAEINGYGKPETAVPEDGDEEGDLEFRQATLDQAFDEEARHTGLTIAFAETDEEKAALAVKLKDKIPEDKLAALVRGEVLLPRFAESESAVWQELEESADCRQQGFFYE